MEFVIVLDRRGARLCVKVVSWSASDAAECDDQLAIGRGCRRRCRRRRRSGRNSLRARRPKNFRRSRDSGEIVLSAALVRLNDRDYRVMEHGPSGTDCALSQTHKIFTD